MNVHLSIKEYVDKCTDLADLDFRIGKISDEIQFIKDSILHNPDVEAMIKQMYANRLMELQTELTKNVTQ